MAAFLTGAPCNNLAFKNSAWAEADRDLFLIVSKLITTFPCGKPNLFSIKASSSFPLIPFLPRATCLFTTLAIMMSLFTVFLILSPE